MVSHPPVRTPHHRARPLKGAPHVRPTSHRPCLSPPSTTLKQSPRQISLPAPCHPWSLHLLGPPPSGNPANLAVCARSPPTRCSRSACSPTPRLALLVMIACL